MNIKRRLKRTLKRMVATTLAITIALTTTITAFANEVKLENIADNEKNIVTIKQIGSTMNYIKYNDGSSLVFPKNISSDNLPAYCLEQAKPNPPSGGITYTNGGEMDKGMTYILENGLHEYGQVDRNPNYLVGNDDYDFYITQTAIHIYQGLNDRFMVSSTGNPNILTNARKLVSDAKVKTKEIATQSEKALTVAITPANQELKFKPDTGYFETGLYSITASGEYTNYKVIANGIPANMEMLNQEGTAINGTSELAPNSKFKFRIRPEHITGNIDINLGILLGYQQKENSNWIPANNMYQRMTTYRQFPTNQLGDNIAKATLSVGNMNLIKTSETGKMDGLRFNILGNGINRTETTDMTGNINITNIPTGVYTVSEVDVPDEFVVPQSQQVSILAGQTAVVNFSNILKKGNISGYKKGDNGMNLQGAEIGLFKSDDTEFTNPVLTRITNEIGYFEFQDIPYGDYNVKEIKSPDGYILSDKIYLVQVRENGVTIEIEDIVNTIIKGSVKGIKTDAISGKPLAGAEIGLYAYTDEDMTKFELVESMITGEDGLFSFKDISYGNYYIMEIASPDGFILSDKKYPVDIFSDGLIVNISMINQPEKGKIDIEYIKPDGKPNISVGTIKNPSTGDVSGILLFIITGLGGLVTLLFMKKRKVNNNG